MTRLTSQELRDLRDQGDWRKLWEHAMPWVRFAASELRTEDREDMTQEGMLAVGRQLKNWNPDRGEFSTYARRVAYSAMLLYIKRKARREDSSHEMPEDFPAEAEEWRPRAAPTYSDTGHTPIGFGDPATEIAREFAQEAAERLLADLSSEDSVLLREALGLPFLEEHGEANRLKDMAGSRSMSISTTHWRIEKIQKDLGKKRLENYMPTTMSIYPPAGRESQRTHQRAEARHPGFWHGLASAMGDTDVWRESVGAVWKDWSWKPTDNDILSGAKP